MNTTQIFGIFIFIAGCFCVLTSFFVDDTFDDIINPRERYK